MLARREHGAQELRRKLAARGYVDDVISTVLAECADRGWQSDLRFAEQFTASRAGRGRGPLKVQAQLRERGIDDATVEAVLDFDAAHWTVTASEVRERRFGPWDDSASMADRARQSRFLAQRGFTSAQVRRAFEQGPVD